jgi:hypothetical protein
MLALPNWTNQTEVLEAVIASLRTASRWVRLRSPLSDIGVQSSRLLRPVPSLREDTSIVECATARQDAFAGGGSFPRGRPCSCKAPADARNEILPSSWRSDDDCPEALLRQLRQQGGFSEAPISEVRSTGHFALARAANRIKLRDYRGKSAVILHYFVGGRLAGRRVGAR